MASSSSTLIALAFFPLILVIQCQAQSAPAPSSSSSGQVNLTAILEKGGQYTTLMKLLASTQVGNQIENQINSSTEGMTLFAPTDNAFNNLKAGSLNELTTQEQVQLVLYHVLPKFYTLENFQTVSNPVPTQASGQNGGQWGLNFTALSGNQVNVSSGDVETQVNNALRQKMPLAVYQVDKVLLPQELFGAKAPASSPSKTPAVADSSNSTESASSSSSGTPAEGPASDSGATVLTNLGWGSIVGLAFISVMSSLS